MASCLSTRRSLRRCVQARCSPPPSTARSRTPSTYRATPVSCQASKPRASSATRTATRHTLRSRANTSGFSGGSRRRMSVFSRHPRASSCNSATPPRSTTVTSRTRTRRATLPRPISARRSSLQSPRTTTSPVMEASYRACRRGTCLARRSTRRRARRLRRTTRHSRRTMRPSPKRRRRHPTTPIWACCSSSRRVSCTRSECRASGTAACWARATTRQCGSRRAGTGRGICTPRRTRS
mmetsp:Transcript_9663/g.19550  ORF Transcript_9663/g.19550 Transcript_9663/m.19550 type:complete len:238 (-) Transcript_9663:262-975(-)